MAKALDDNLITEDEYLKNELVSETKHEYINGQTYAMAGTKKNHDRISTNIIRKFGNHLERRSCEVFGVDVKVKTAASRYRYTDGMVVCDDSGDDTYTETPVIIVEVISKSTRHIDRGAKLLEYINIPTLKEYIIIEQDFVSIDVYRRSDKWISRNYALDDDVCFESIDLTLSVEEIYARVDNEDMIEFMVAKSER